MFFSFWAKQCLDNMVGSITFTKIPLSLFALISWSPKRAHWCFSDLQWCVLSSSGVWTRIDDHLSQITDVCLLCVLSLSDQWSRVFLRSVFVYTNTSKSEPLSWVWLPPAALGLFVQDCAPSDMRKSWSGWLCEASAVFSWAGRSSKPPARKCSFWMNGIKSILVFGLCCFIPLVYLRWPKVCFGWNSYFSIAKVQTSEFNQKLEFHKKKRFVRQLCSPIPRLPAGLSSRWPISRLSSLWNWHQCWVDTWCRSSI